MLIGFWYMEKWMRPACLIHAKRRVNRASHVHYYYNYTQVHHRAVQYMYHAARLKRIFYRLKRLFRALK